MVLAFSTSLYLCSICQHTSIKCHFDYSCPRIRLWKIALKEHFIVSLKVLFVYSGLFLCQIDITAVVNSLSHMFLTIPDLHWIVNVYISREHLFIITLIFWLRPVYAHSFNCEIACAIILTQEIHESHFWRCQGNMLST